MPSTVVVAWYKPVDIYGDAIAKLTRSVVCHVGAAIVMNNTTTYINVGPPALSLLTFIPQPTTFIKTLVVDDATALVGYQYLTSMAGKPYADSIIASDLINALAGTHLQISVDGDQVCSGMVANLLVRMALYQTTTPDQETPQLLLIGLGHD